VARGAPLTYYRAGSRKSSSSPFEKNTQLHGRRHKFFVRLVDLLIISSIIFCFIYSLIVQPNPKISINNTSYHDAYVYRNDATAKLKSLKNRTKLTLDEQGLIKALQDKFPEINGGTVELPLFDEKPTLNIIISPPAFYINNGDIRYVVSAQGRAVAMSSAMPNIRNLPVVNDQSGFQASPGKQVLGASGISFIQTVIAQCKHAGVPISSLTLPKLAQELDLRTTDRPYYVKFYLGGDADIQVGQYLASRHQFDATNAQPSEYLDVRVQGKVFYK
jgi:hypothetical protein